MELAMTAPFIEAGDGSLLIALGIGIAFGWTLERAGLGSARKLVGQFYLTDLTVFKVMFSAIVTAMLGTFWLGWLGILDLSRVYVPETYLPSQIVGGLVFGIGFALAGLCPGTSCVAAASGRVDGAAVVAGMFSGVLATGLAFPALQRFYESGARGSFTVPELLHVRTGIVICAVVGVALAGFWVAERLERGAIAGSSVRRRPVVMAAAAVTLAVSAAFIPRSDRTAEERVSAIELASWIKDRRPDLRILDVRSASDFDEYHIPTADRTTIDGLSDLRIPPDSTIAIYSETADRSVRLCKLLRERGYRHVYYVPGGAADWLDQVMNPTLPKGASPEARAAFAKTREISLYFGGVPRVDAAPGDAHVSAQQVRRRGC
jgi:uncharacterized protein